MSIRDAARELIDALAGAHSATFADKPAYEVVDLVAVHRESSDGVPEVFEGRVDGQAVVYVTAGGVALSVNDRVLAVRTGDSPLGQEYRYDKLLASNNPAAGYMLIDANIPAPLFGDPPSVSNLITSGGAITASIVVNVVPIAERYRPSRYLVSWAYVSAPGNWNVVPVGHVAGAASIPVLIGNSFMPGTEIYVKLETEVNYAQRRSVESATITVEAAGDNGSPATLNTVTVSIDAAGHIVITPNATLNDVLFLDWEYSYANSAAGAGAQVVYARGPLTLSLGAGVSKYVAVRARARNGAFGNRIPSDPSTWAGPYTTIAPTVPPDTIPPATPGEPDVTPEAVQTVDGVWRGYLNILPDPLYVEPADFDHYEVSISGTNGGGWLLELPISPVLGTPYLRVEVGFGGFSVSMRAVDEAGNASAYGPAFDTSIDAPELSTVTPVVTTSAVGAGIKVEWQDIGGALDYEVQRALTATPGTTGSYPAEVAADLPLVHFPGDESSGTTAVNVGSHAPDGTYVGSPQFRAQAPQGLYGVHYDGVDDAITLADAAALDITGDLTLEALVFPIDRLDYRMIITKANVGTGEYQWYLTVTSGQPVFYDTTGIAGAVFATAAPPLNQWSHIAVTRTGRVVAHYLNGAANGGGTLPGAAPTATTEPVRIGRRGDAAPSLHMFGRIAQPAIYNSAKSGARIAAHSAAILNPPERTIGVADASFFFDSLAEDTAVEPTYYYRVRARAVEDGLVIVGTWSAWTAGTAGKVDARNLRLRSVTAEELAADSVTANKIQAGAIVTGKLAADVVVSSILRTANTGTRWEIRGSGVAAPASSILMYENVAGTDRKRLTLDGTGFYVHNDSAGSDVSMVRNSAGRVAVGVQGVTITHDGTRPYMSIAVAPSGGGLGQLRLANLHGTDIIQGSTFAGINTVEWSRANDGNDAPTFAVRDNTFSGQLGIYRDGIEARNGGVAATLRHDTANNRWQRIVAKGIQVGLSAGYSPGYEHGHFRNAVLASAGGSYDPFVNWEYYATDSNLMNMHLGAYKGQTAGDWADCRFIFNVGLNNHLSAGLGSLQIGARGYSAFWALGVGGTSQMFYNATVPRIETTLGMHVGGTLTATTKSFIIPHPDPAKADRYELRHSNLEGPTRGQTVYSYSVSLGPRGGNLVATDSEGRPAEATVKDLGIGGESRARWSVEVKLPDYFAHLNELPRCFAVNTGDGWGRCKASVNRAGTELTLLAEEAGEYSILILAVRKDADARAWWDRRGVQKTKAQQWTNSATIERRQQTTEAKRHARAHVAGERMGAAADPGAADAEAIAGAMHDRASRRRVAVAEDAAAMVGAMHRHMGG